MDTVLQVGQEVRWVGNDHVQAFGLGVPCTVINIDGRTITAERRNKTQIVADTLEFRMGAI